MNNWKINISFGVMPNCIYVLSVFCLYFKKLNKIILDSPLKEKKKKTIVKIFATILDHRHLGDIASFSFLVFF